MPEPPAPSPAAAAPSDDSERPPQSDGLQPAATQQAGGAEEPPQQQEQQAAGGGAEAHARWPPRWQLPAVPWGLATTITLMAVWGLCFMAAAYSFVPYLLGLVGVQLGGSGGSAAWAQALRHLVLDTLQVGFTVLLLQRGLGSYHPRRLGLFAFPLRPLRQWLPAVAAGAATFPLVDWVHKRLVTALAEEAIVSGTAEQILGTTSWGTQALWFAVLALAAPVWEELMFRGFLLPSLAAYLPPWAAVAATSLVFALVHFSRDGLLPLLLLGCVFGAAYAATRNLLAPIALHSLWNCWLLAQLLRAGAGIP